MRRNLPHYTIGDPNISDHLGLAYDVYVPVETKGSDAGKVAPDNDFKVWWLEKIAASRISCHYRHAYDRWKRSFVQPIDNTFEWTFETRLLVGSGYASGSEVGLTVHRTWGVPIIPGPGLKGLTANYVQRTYGPFGTGDADYEGVTWDRTRIRRGPGQVYRALFGAPDALEDGQMLDQGRAAGAIQGLVTFHDAWLVPCNSEVKQPLALDVLTVHQKEYYNSTGKVSPTDYDDPNPVNFLSVKPGATFLFVVSCPHDEWAALAGHFLREALVEWGIGSKTSSGYGQMRNAETP